jgi:uncharacterized protein YqgC (DUF456 family)
MELLCWLGVIVLFAIGLLGTVVPVLPGSVIILGAAVAHRLLVPPEKTVSWFVIALMVLLTAATYAIDFAASYFGAKRFGATKWGSFGAIVGAIVGLFFGLPGLLIGPVVGVIAFEFFRGRQLIAAGKAGWGTLLGNIGGMLLKLVIAIAMIVIFLMNVPSPV